jgi:formate dehydrogenase subunit beta
VFFINHTWKRSRSTRKAGRSSVIRESGTISNASPYRSRTGYVLHTDGKPLDALQTFLRDWWAVQDFHAMLAPVQSPGCCSVFPQVLTDPEQLPGVNPFAPVLPVNSAGLIDDLLSAYPEGNLAVILRPCELRTWVEMRKRRADSWGFSDQRSDRSRLLLLSVDCPGTLSSVEFAHRAASDGIAALTDEALDWAAHSRWINNRLRQACQNCDWPVPNGADLTIGLLGLDAEQLLLLIPGEKANGSLKPMEALADEPATEDIFLRRYAAAALVTERHSGHLPGAGHRENGSTLGLLATFARCTMCTDCLDACPLYDGELAGMLGVPGTSTSSAPLLVNLVGVSRWLASCSGCGMCQDACGQEIPLLNIVLDLNYRMRRELDYRPGDPDLPLPWT